MRVTVKCIHCKKVSIRNRNSNKRKNIFCNNRCHGYWIISQRNNRFWSRVVKGKKCWSWNGKKHSFGYGHFLDRGAHRFSYIIHFGSIPKGKSVLHKCDNPECVNPKHLKLGTPADNSSDMKKSGRSLVGEKNPNHKLTWIKVNEIRKIYPNIMSSRKIGKMYGVTKKVIVDIVKNRIWKV